MLDFYRAVVHADADRYESIEDSLSVSYDAGYSDATFRPLVFGDYLGVRGELTRTHEARAILRTDGRGLGLRP